MSNWFKAFNTLPHHPKMVAATAGVACHPGWLYIAAIGYSNEHLLDGAIPHYALPTIAPGNTQVETAADRLVQAGLWEVTDTGWRIHDYLDVQRSSEDIRRQREKDAARKRSDRQNGSHTESKTPVRADSSRTPRTPSGRTPRTDKRR